MRLGPQSVRHTRKEIRILTLPTPLIFIGCRRTWRSDICGWISSHSRSIFGRIIFSYRAVVCYELHWFWRGAANRLWVKGVNIFRLLLRGGRAELRVFHRGGPRLCAQTGSLLLLPSFFLAPLTLTHKHKLTTRAEAELQMHAHALSPLITPSRIHALQIG